MGFSLIPPPSRVLSHCDVDTEGLSPLSPQTAREFKALSQKCLALLPEGKIPTQSGSKSDVQLRERVSSASVQGGHTGRCGLWGFLNPTWKGSPQPLRKFPRWDPRVRGADRSRVRGFLSKAPPKSWKSAAHVLRIGTNKSKVAYNMPSPRTHFRGQGIFLKNSRLSMPKQSGYWKGGFETRETKEKGRRVTLFSAGLPSNYPNFSKVYQQTLRVSVVFGRSSLGRASRAKHFVLPQLSP